MLLPMHESCRSATCPTMVCPAAHASGRVSASHLPEATGQSGHCSPYRDFPGYRRAAIGPAVALFVLGSAGAAASAASAESAQPATACDACLDDLAADYVRPYGPKAPWNVRVTGLPHAADSAVLVAKAFHDDRTGLENLNLSFDSYTYPVYDARQAADWYPIETTYWTNLRGTAIPWNPAWEPSAGSDGQVIVLDPPTGREWDLWRVRFGDGRVHATNGSLVDGGTFIPGTKDWPGSYWVREQGWTFARGCGIMYLAMLVRPAEIARGEVPHALSMPTHGIDDARFVPPATKLDGDMPGVGIPDGIPEGTRFALRVTDAEIEAWIASLPATLPDATRRSARVIARALRDYGWFVTDNAGSDHLQLEDRLTAGPAWSALGLDYVSAGGKEYPRDLLDGLVTRERVYAIIPSDRYPEPLRPTNGGRSATAGGSRDQRQPGRP
jgi:hypothetical protein